MKEPLSHFPTGGDTSKKQKRRPSWFRLLGWGAFLVVLGLLAAGYFVMVHGVAASGSLLESAGGPEVSRAEVVAVAREYAEHRWPAVAENVRNGVDSRGIPVNTPDVSTGRAGQWQIGAENLGVPYKWGGFDSLDSFDAGLQKRLAAGDIYSSAKRRSGQDSVTEEAVGIDCSGFISRCWQLPNKLGTKNLPGVCSPLESTSDLKPGDVMNQPRGHVVLFVSWLDASKQRARFYEAKPLSKVVASEYDVHWLRLKGAKPLRYQRIRD